MTYCTARSAVYRSYICMQACRLRPAFDCATADPSRPQCRVVAAPPSIRTVPRAPVSAAALAARQVDAVRDDPRARLRLASETYERRLGAARRHLPFRRAAMSFMRWEERRGLLNPLHGSPPGSPWWRALNARLLRDGCEAVARASGHGGTQSSPTIGLWMQFIARPSARSWYRAHNASIVAAYLEHRDLAERECRIERFFLNVVLLRVLYAHALVAAPDLALGPCAPLGRLLGDPRLGMAGAFLSLGRVLPARYPAQGDLDQYLQGEHGIGRTLDYAVIAPRLQELYVWSARELGLPGLAQLIWNGSPVYAWPREEHAVWDPPALAILPRVVAHATAHRPVAVPAG